MHPPCPGITNTSKVVSSQALRGQFLMWVCVSLLDSCPVLFRWKRGTWWPASAKSCIFGAWGGCGEGYWVPWITRPLCSPGKTPPDLLASGADARRFAAHLNLLARVPTSAVSGSLRPKVHAPDCAIGWHLSHLGLGWHPGHPPQPIRRGRRRLGNPPARGA